jgi:hypothetical protein
MPRREPNDIPKSEPAMKLPDFCHSLYEFCSLISIFSPAATALEVSKPMALSINGSTTTKFMPAKTKPDMAPETREIKTKSRDFIKIYFGFPLFEE